MHTLPLPNPAINLACQSAGADFAVLVGSRASRAARADSDWDIAIALPADTDPLQRLGKLEVLRYALAHALDTPAGHIDLIDLYSAGLAMREQVANHGILLYGNGTLAWSRFLTRTWRELEDFEYERNHGF